MTAGSYCYIGPQGIVHGTTVRGAQLYANPYKLKKVSYLFEYIIRISYHVQLTVLNAGRLYMDTDDLSGKVFVTSGLGGMSGAQAKVQEYLNRF